VADNSIKIWLDSSFFHAEEGIEEITVDVRPATLDNIGSRITPVELYSVPYHEAKYNISVKYSNDIIIYEDLNFTPVEYFSYIQTLTSGSYYVDVSYNTSDGDITDSIVDFKTAYETAYYTVSGSYTNIVNSVAGLGINYVNVTPVDSIFYDEIVVSLSYWANYTNYSGDHSVIDDSPIPSRSGVYDLYSEYGRQFYETTSGTNWVPVDVFFASWIPTPITFDVYSSIKGFKFGYVNEVTTISGGKLPHYIDIISSTSGIEFLKNDIYCALTDYVDLGTDIATISGSISYNNSEVFSSAQENLHISLDINLHSVKIANFSLGIGDYILAESILQVDLLDDLCQIDKSKSYLLVDGNEVYVTFSGITDGYRMFYDPIDDFESFSGPTTLTVHAENECGDYLEQNFYLTYGYVVEYNNVDYSDPNSIDFKFGNKVSVRVTAEDNASCPKMSSLAWEFGSREEYNSDLQASITGRFHALDTEELSAEIYPNSSAYFYGKTMKIVVEAKDFAGNKMEPFVLVYKIEDKPVK
jgi:hypothetical protein